MLKLSILIFVLSVVAINGRPGPPINAAEEARRMVHMSNWASVGTISTIETMEGFPMVNVLSVADSKVGAPSTGIIYFFMMDQDITAMDTKKNNKVTFMFTEAQEGECKKRNVDPCAHLCMRTMISGTVKKMQMGTDEYNQGMEAFYSRHPTAVTSGTPTVDGHEYYLCKLEVTNVMVFGWGGYKFPTPEEYMAGTDAVVAKV